MSPTASSPQKIPESAPDITFARIEEGQIDELHENMQAILDETGGHNAEVFSPALWRWHYRDLPSGEAYAYGAFDRDGKLVGYFHIAVYQGFVSGQPKKFGIIQDVAMSASTRGRGAFWRLENFAEEDLANTDVDLQHIFPNKRSFRTFAKYDSFEHIADLPTYVTPISSAKLLRSKLNLFGVEHLLGSVADASVRVLGKRLGPGEEVRLHDDLDSSLIDVFGEFQREHSIALARDSEFLKWRYVQNPNPHHYFLSLTSGGEPRAVAIFKADEMFGNLGLLLMDFAYRQGEEGALLKLLSEVRAHPDRYIDREVRFILTMGLGKFFGELYKIGFARIPAFANPRVLRMLVKNLRLEDGEMIRKPENWHVTLSDWDVL